MQTYGGFQWKLGEWKSTPGKGELCTAGWIHCYDGLELALLMNHIHANFQNPLAFEIETRGRTLNDHGRKRGVESARLIRRLSRPKITREMRFGFARAARAAARAARAQEDINLAEIAHDIVSGRTSTARAT